MPGSRPSRIRRVFIFLKTCYNELMKNIVQKKYIIKKARPILKKSGVKKAALFGSAARGDMTRKSEIDFVIVIVKIKYLFCNEPRPRTSSARYNGKHRAD